MATKEERQFNDRVRAALGDGKAKIAETRSGERTRGSKRKRSHDRPKRRSA